MRHVYTFTGHMVTDQPLTPEEIDWLTMRMGMHVDDPEGVEDVRHADWTRTEWSFSVVDGGTLA